MAKAAGFSLVEVLTSMLIVAIATAGLIRWQVAMINAQHQLAANNNAIRLASELADWIRALPDTAIRDHFSTISSLLHQAPVKPAASCFYTDCMPDEQIAFDLFEWQQRFIQAVPEAHILVCRGAQSAAASKQEAIWECDEPDDAAAPVTIKMGWGTSLSASGISQLVMTTGRISDE